MKIILSILVLILAVAFAMNKSASAQTVGDITAIALKNDGGFGYDKGYEIVLHKNGAASYIGGANSYPRKGKFRGAITKQQFDRLARLIVSKDFFTLKDRYEVKLYDAATITTTVVYKNGRKTVVNPMGSAGRNLSDIENAIETIAAKIQWVKEGEEQNKPSANSQSKNDTSKIDSLLELRNLSFDDVMRKFSLTANDIEKDVGYQKLENLTAIGDKTRNAPHFFFQNNKLVMIYFTEDTLRERNLTASDFFKKLANKTLACVHAQAKLIA